jgi:TRAP-type transport system periplasmic protein
VNGARPPGRLGPRHRAVLASVALACVLGHSAAARGADLIFNTYLPPFDSVRKVLVDDFAARVEQASGGEVKVSVPGSSLAPSNRQWEIVQSRVADIAVVGLYTERSRTVLPLLADLPLSCESAEAASVALWQTQQAWFAAFQEFRGVRLLAMYVLPPLRFISKTHQLKSLADLKGLKVWVPASEVTNSVSALGGVPVYSSLAQMFEYTSKGTVDALLTSPSAIKQAHLGDYVHFMTEVPGGFGSVSFAVIMNEASFAGLSPAGQQAVLQAAEGLPARVGAALDQRDRSGLAELHLEVSMAGPELERQIRAALAFQESDWLAAAKGRGLAHPEEALKFYRETMRHARRDGTH